MYSAIGLEAWKHRQRPATRDYTDCTARLKIGATFRFADARLPAARLFHVPASNFVQHAYVFTPRTAFQL